VIAEFTSAVNEFAGITGYSVIVLSVVYLAVKIGAAFLKRD